MGKQWGDFDFGDSKGNSFDFAVKIITESNKFVEIDAFQYKLDYIVLLYAFLMTQHLVAFVVDMLNSKSR
jgi:hypothetical protein